MIALEDPHQRLLALSVLLARLEQGEPADTDVVNATVVAPSAVEAEVGAKVALILGSEEGIEWLEARPTMAGLLALADGTILISSRMHALLWQG